MTEQEQEAGEGVTSAALGFFRLADLATPIDFAALFDREAPLELEIGTGRGDFLLSYAAAHPERNFVALERKLTILRRAIRKFARAKLNNVRVINAEAQHLLREYVAPETFDAVHVYFPDPWPKVRHANRRIMREETAGVFARVLKPKGWLHVRTDQEDYFRAMIALMQGAAGFEKTEVPEEVVQFKTGYELKFESRELPIFRASYRRLV